MAIRIARVDELDYIMQNYHVMSDYPGQVESGAGWIKDIYPSREMIEKALHAGTYIAIELDNKIVAGMIVNEEYTEGYEEARWNVEAKAGEFISIHALGVVPDYRGKGLARELVQYAIEYGQEQNYKAIRIDVLANNIAAMKLYPSEGFHHTDTIKLYYEDTGLTDYLMYEFIL